MEGNDGGKRWRETMEGNDGGKRKAKPAPPHLGAMRLHGTCSTWQGCEGREGWEGWEGRAVCGG
jgi:hypothetical protein